MLTVSTTTAANTAYEVTFEILNPSVAQSTPTLSLEAVIEAGAFPPPIPPVAWH